MYCSIAFVLFSILLFFILMSLIMIDLSRSKKFTNGTWIDRDGNLLVMKLQKRKILLSFGVNTENDEYELTEKEYSYICTKIPFSSTYKIRVSNGVCVSINIVSGIATVYDKKKKIGKFAKNNLITFD